MSWNPKKWWKVHVEDPLNDLGGNISRGWKSSGRGISNWWKSLPPEWRAVIIIAAFIAVGVLTGGAAAPFIAQVAGQLYAGATVTWTIGGAGAAFSAWGALAGGAVGAYAGYDTSVSMEKRYDESNDANRESISDNQGRGNAQPEKPDGKPSDTADKTSPTSQPTQRTSEGKSPAQLIRQVDSSSTSNTNRLNRMLDRAEYDDQYDPVSDIGSDYGATEWQSADAGAASSIPSIDQFSEDATGISSLSIGRQRWVDPPIEKGISTRPERGYSDYSFRATIVARGDGSGSFDERIVFDEKERVILYKSGVGTDSKEAGDMGGVLSRRDETNVKRVQIKLDRVSGFRPERGGDKDSSFTALDVVHTALGLGSMVPGYGIGFAVTDAAIYALEGNYTGVALAAAGPLVGPVARLGKLSEGVLPLLRQIDFAEIKSAKAFVATVEQLVRRDLTPGSVSAAINYSYEGLIGANIWLEAGQEAPLLYSGIIGSLDEAVIKAAGRPGSGKFGNEMEQNIVKLFGRDLGITYKSKLAYEHGFDLIRIK